MIWQLMQRDLAWKRMRWFTLAVAAFCALWHFLTSADKIRWTGRGPAVCGALCFPDRGDPRVSQAGNRHAFSGDIARNSPAGFSLAHPCVHGSDVAAIYLHRAGDTVRRHTARERACVADCRRIAGLGYCFRACRSHPGDECRSGVDRGRSRPHDMAIPARIVSGCTPGRSARLIFGP